MKPHRACADDRRFRAAFESCRLDPSDFDHRGHLRLAYSYLVEHDVEQTLDKLRAALVGFLAHHGIDPTKYHETMTRAWILAMRHFMEVTPQAASSADELIDANPKMLDTRIMLSHYSTESLFSDAARARFVEPDLDPIPRHE